MAESGTASSQIPAQEPSPDLPASHAHPAGTPAPDTRERLLASAEALFSEKWVSVVSVADICRSAGLSNGVFYSYFRGKEAILRAIVERFLDDITRRLAALPAGPEDPEAGIAALTEMLFSLARDEKRRMSIFREAQYRYPEFEQRMRTALISRLEEILGRACSPAETIYVLSGIRFAAFRSAFNGTPTDPVVIHELICRGVFSQAMPADLQPVFDIQATLNPVKLISTSRDRLVAAGRSLFGASGFHEVNIHQITSDAGLSVGTFYNYFPAKEDLFREVIGLVGHDIRAFIGRNLDRELPRIAQEIQGMWLFAFYLTVEKTAYNLVREAEFVLPESVKDYYDAFARGYGRGLAGYRGTSPAELESVSAFLMGISHYFGMEILFDRDLSHAQATLTDLGELLHRGIGVQHGAVR